jgi:Predicted deacetylase
LRDLEARGYEIVIHGYFHQRPRRSNERITEKFVTRIYTRDEGEFFDLDYEEAFARILKLVRNLKPRVFPRLGSSPQPGC